jgi:hypothetical protein
MVYADDPGVPGYAPRVWAYLLQPICLGLGL